MGRPRNKAPYKKCSFQLDQSVYDEFSEFCEKNCITKGLLFTQIIKRYLNDVKKSGKKIL